MLPSNYPVLRPLSCCGSKETVSPECESFLFSIIPARPSSAFSVWYPRLAPTQRLTSRLKRFNSAFLDLNDSTSFADGNVFSVLTLNPTFLSTTLREQVLSSWERLLTIIDDLHQGRLDFATMDTALCHVSRVGLLKTVVAEVVAIRTSDRRLLEFIIIETFLDRSNTPRLPRYGPQYSTNHRFHFKWAKTDAATTQWHSVDINVHQQSRTSAPFICEMCGLTKTTQRRYEKQAPKKPFRSSLCIDVVQLVQTHYVMLVVYAFGKRTFVAGKPWCRFRC